VNFGTPSISRERLKLETLNLACRLATGRPKEKNAKLGQKGPEVTRDLLLEFWDPSISQERLKLKTSNLACRLIARDLNEIMLN